MAEYTPVLPPANAYTLTTNGAVTGGRAIAVSGNGVVAHAGAASAAVIGVAAFDAASGAQVTVHLRGPVHEATASGAITAGDRVNAAAAGVVATGVAAFTNIGIALTTAADGALVRYVGL